MEAYEIVNQQMKICEKYKTEWSAAALDQMIGVSKNFTSGVMPINGLRHSPEKGTAGWYIWAGEYSEADDFFEPLHIQHLIEKYPDILKYLGLPPGYRFQIDNKGYEDVWYDEKLLNPN